MLVWGEFFLPPDAVCMKLECAWTGGRSIFSDWSGGERESIDSQFIATTHVPELIP